MQLFVLFYKYRSFTTKTELWQFKVVKKFENHNFLITTMTTRFWRFRTYKDWKRFKMNKKCWKRLKKSSWTSFQVRAAPESWSKYTTAELNFFNFWSSLLLRLDLGFSQVQQLVLACHIYRWYNNVFFKSQVVFCSIVVTNTAKRTKLLLLVIYLLLFFCLPKSAKFIHYHLKQIKLFLSASTYILVSYQQSKAS